jgi:acetyl esterase/lipase
MQLRFLSSLLSVALLVTPLAATVAAPPPAAPAKKGDYVDQIGEGLQPTRKVIYKKVAGRELELHVFEPQGFKKSDQRACYIIIHGGGWSGMTPVRMFPFADHFARLGMVGISVQYRLYSPKAGVTVFDCVKDARSAVRYVRAHAAEFGIDPRKIIVSGGSAGGHLAAATAQFDGVNEDGEDTSVSCRPDALVLLFPVIDTSPEGYGQTKIGEQWRDLSPAHQVKAGMPPTLLFHGTGDTVTPYQGALDFHEAMIKAGNRCELVPNEGGVHGYLMRTQPLYDETQAKTETFLRSLGLL